MGPARVLKIASRQSDLARLQTESVAAAISKNFPEIKIELLFRASLGDQNQNDPLWKMPEKGVFTEDFYLDLVGEKVDLVVHSWKDLPIEPKPDTEIAATLERADQRDLLLLRKDRTALIESTAELKVLTSSPRRAYNLEGFFKTYLPYKIARPQFLNVRGNILTRIKKLFSEDADALIVAKAAIDRLLSSRDPQYALGQQEIRQLFDKCRWMCLPLSLNPTAAAQGAIAIEAKKNSPWKDVLAKIHDEECFRNVLKEREILARYGGGCHQKIGISLLSRTFGEVCFLRGLTDQGQVLDSIALSNQRPFEKAKSKEHIFPSGETKIFERIPIDASPVHDPFLWIVKDEALPKTTSLTENQIVWCSGLKTWRKLARRGIWVNGSSEGLGETEKTRIDALAGPARWTKLTHDQGYQNPEMKILSTYRLKALDLKLNLDEVTHFFWTSGSTFDLIVERYPQIKKAWHFCGPGHSFDHIKKRLGSDEHLRICLSFEDWRHQVL